MSCVQSEHSCCSATFGTRVVTAAMETHQHRPKSPVFMEVVCTMLETRTHQVFRASVCCCYCCCCGSAASVLSTRGPDPTDQQDHIWIYKAVGRREVLLLKRVKNSFRGEINEDWRTMWLKWLVMTLMTLLQRVATCSSGATGIVPWNLPQRSPLRQTATGEVAHWSCWKCSWASAEKDWKEGFNHGKASENVARVGVMVAWLLKETYGRSKVLVEMCESINFLFMIVWCGYRPLCFATAFFRLTCVGDIVKRSHRFILHH